MKKLSVSIDQIGLLRESRKLRFPDPVAAAAVIELAGADSISIHLRLDRRGIRERDLYILKETCKTRLNLHIAPKPEMLALISEVKPQEVTLLPERPGELYTERGLSFEHAEDYDEELLAQIQGAGSRLYALIEPELSEVKAAAKAGCDGVELYSLTFAMAKTEADQQAEFDKLAKASELGAKQGLEIRIGGGLNYRNIFPLLKIDALREFVVGHALISQALMVGLSKAVEDMVTLVKWS